MAPWEPKTRVERGDRGLIAYALERRHPIYSGSAFRRNERPFSKWGRPGGGATTPSQPQNRERAGRKAATACLTAHPVNSCLVPVVRQDLQCTVRRRCGWTAAGCRLHAPVIRDLRSARGWQPVISGRMCESLGFGVTAGRIFSRMRDTSKVEAASLTRSTASKAGS